MPAHGALLAAIVAVAAVDMTACARRYIPGIAASVTRPDVYSTPSRGTDVRSSTVEPARGALPTPAKTPPRVVRPSSAKPATTQPIGTTGADFVGPQPPPAGSVTVTTTPGSTGTQRGPAVQSHSVTMRNLRRSTTLPTGAGLIAAALASAAWYRRRHRVHD